MAENPTGQQTAGAVTREQLISLLNEDLSREYQAIIAYVTLRGGADAGIDELRTHVAGEIGAIAKPKTVYLTPDLPKTRSGKIMRRLLRDIATGHNLGDTTTLADATVVDEIKRRATEAPPED